MNRIRRWSIPALAATALLGSLTLTAPALAATAPAGDTAAVVRAQDQRAAAPKITRAEEIRRAQRWLTANGGKPVPYSQHKNWKDGYRQDCSGYASMALGLPKSGPNTVALKNDGWTKPIKMSELRRGDLVIKANSGDPDHRHVVIFDGWNSGKGSYQAYEQAGHVGTRHASHSYGLKSGDGYHAYRPVNLAD
ncbi:hypothetical protein [Streptomyces sp. CBMA156]|uniref:hypothetical protein n=1 Tax=Streptomyces sp. CBMA156 TaxID=1930280 RepID=UPI001661BE67|nr:hypothetical protein [Streptomyces sp. CBMA156]MBD0676303.1 hypothetical protein [Streptomyces sp. CBMA156]MBD0676770.1 hypothetical protein [Streptomyces sp. CBMA156]